jgi:GNAT superfamily N-acetyltransferase
MRIDRENCEEKTGFPLDYFLQLTGIFGIHETFHESDCIEFNVDIDDDRVTVEIETILVEELSRTIYLDSKKIKNVVMIGTKEGKGTGIGLKLLASQVDYAVKYGFNKIVIDAYKDLHPSPTPKYKGYSYWPQYGFVMDGAEKIKFSQLMEISKRSEKSIFDLVQSSEGLKFWIKHGFKWLGSFDLEENSWSREILENAKKRKGIG